MGNTENTEQTKNTDITDNAENTENTDFIDDTGNRLIDLDKLVLNWDLWASALLIFWCLQPLLSAAARIYHPVVGAAVSAAVFFIAGIAACVICLLFVLDRINCEQGGFFLRLWREGRWVLFLAVIIAWAGISALLADDVQTALLGSAYRLDGYISYVIYAGFFGCGLIIADKKKLMTVIKCFAGASAVLGAISIAALLPPVVNSPSVYCISLRYMRQKAIFDAAEHYGSYLAMAIICAMGLFVFEKHRAKSAAWFLVGLFNIWVLTDNGTAACLIAVPAALLVLAFAARPRQRALKSFLPAIAFILLFLCLLPVYRPSLDIQSDITHSHDHDHDHDHGQEQTETVRLPWAQTIDLILKRPVFGYGPEGLIGRYTDSCRDRPNNEYLQHAAFMGIPGLLLYLAALIALLSHRIKHRAGLPAFVIISGTACLGYAISAFFGNTMYYTVPCYALLLGMAANMSYTPENADMH
jgi:O-antigen ligase